MLTAVEFKRDIKVATTKGTGSSLKSASGTNLIAWALEAYDKSVADRQAQAEQAAYLYQVIKNCKAWIARKQAKQGGNTDARRTIINQLLLDARAALLNDYPLIQQALGRYEAKKDHHLQNLNGRPATTSLHGVYAHEGQVFREAKARGQFYDPGKQRFTPSASLMADKYEPHQKKFGNKDFQDLTFEEYTKLDKLLKAQYKVLYLSKIQRIDYMVAIDNGLFVRAKDNTVIDLPGRVNYHLGGGQLTATQMYVCDRYGNLFVTTPTIRDVRREFVQVNHSTLAAGNEVLCAGSISIKGGRLRGITDRSGHYQPTLAALIAMVQTLANEGVDLQGVVVQDGSPARSTEGTLFLQGQYGQFPMGMDPLTLLNATA